MCVETAASIVTFGMYARRGMVSLSFQPLVDAAPQEYRAKRRIILLYHHEPCNSKD